MNLSIAIVGLPNVGKSTLFNALLKQQAALAANYPFATIEPNVGVVPVPDDRLAVLAETVATTVIKPATVEFVDIAGLVKGASQGEGLGNQFLAHIRETAAICHVLRAFTDPDIIREGAVDPVNDLATIRTELQLADLATLDKQQQPKGSVKPTEKVRWQLIQQWKAGVEQGQSIAQIAPTGIEPALVTQLAKELNLLTAKPELFALNIDEDQLGEAEQLITTWATKLGVAPTQIIIVSAKIESELSSLSEEDQKLYLQDLGLAQSGLERLISAAYQTLQLQSFLTAGVKEVRAWTIKRGTKAPQAAAVIHTDFEKHFIQARIAQYADFIALNGWKGVKEAGKLRLEGREYVLQEGDVVEFLIGQ